MGVVLGIDYGLKRTGLALSDVLKMIGSPLETVESSKLLEHLKSLAAKHDIEVMVIGLPKGLDNRDTDGTKPVLDFIKILTKTFPAIKIVEMDERFTSKMAKRSMIDGNVPKMKRRDKGLVDKISAALILQSYLDQ